MSGEWCFDEGCFGNGSRWWNSSGGVMHVRMAERIPLLVSGAMAVDRLLLAITIPLSDGYCCCDSSPGSK